MPGMLPVLLVARKRRFSRGGEPTSTNSFSLQRSISSNSTTIPSSSSSIIRTTCEDGTERLEQSAKEAKERLDERLLKAENRLTLLRQTRNKNQQTENQSQEQEQEQQEGKTLMLMATRKYLATVAIGRRWVKKKLNDVVLVRGRGWWKQQQQKEEEYYYYRASVCVVCLEKLLLNWKVEDENETVSQLPCGHRFHSTCLFPWLQTNAHCPCCRMPISTPS